MIVSSPCAFFSNCTVLCSFAGHPRLTSIPSSIYWSHTELIYIFRHSSVTNSMFFWFWCVLFRRHMFDHWKTPKFLFFQAISCYFATWTFATLTQTIGDSFHSLLYLWNGLIFCPLYLDIHKCYFQLWTSQPWRNYYLASSINQDVPHLMDQQAQLLMILHVTSMSINIFPQREEKHLILAMIRSGISPTRNQKKAIKCVCNPNSVLTTNQ